ncbi:hypothetical protein MYSTI_01522 [Myxococcus stipitatus DSM 14675]|uniref:Uncharacterized protein n=1 Tax=Myxococcus stipitatus (strain DSM 14675 / JCM 12634 / Mx s8) TaxID=1278073 RepID=L7U5K5_MYXSD|nr:hypothetical protein MYSTI_01522 [Myxococcus stipitatus DSM 14675]
MRDNGTSLQLGLNFVDEVRHMANRRSLDSATTRVASSAWRVLVASRRACPSRREAQAPISQLPHKKTQPTLNPTL